MEEASEIVPAIEACHGVDDVDVRGPFSADTVFLRASRGEFDAVVACYHDQAMIPVKCLSFGEAVNVTMGLPFIRTSVDHGTAFDIAGKGLAEHSSMLAAIKLAAELSTSAGESGPCSLEDIAFLATPSFCPTSPAAKTRRWPLWLRTFASSCCQLTSRSRRQSGWLRGIALSEPSILQTANSDVGE